MVTAPRRRGDADRFGRMFTRVEITALLSNPFGRPTGWIVLFGGVINGLILAPALAPLTGNDPAALAVGVPLGIVIILGVYAAAAPRWEARSFAAAPYRWLLRTGHGSSGAYAKPDRRGRLTLYSVWAIPWNKGIGAELMRQVLRDTVEQGLDLWLVAVNRRAARFYRRCGFNPVNRELLGTRMVLRCEGTTDRSDR